MSITVNYTNIPLINVLDQNPDPVSVEKTERGFCNKSTAEKITRIALAAVGALLISGAMIAAAFLLGHFSIAVVIVGCGIIACVGALAATGIAYAVIR